MNYKSIIKRQSFVIAMCVICLAVILTGTSYALFFQINTNTDNQVVEAGTLSVTYGKQSQMITETDLVPMTDSSALQSSSVSSTIYIQNDGTLPATYELKIGANQAAFDLRENPLPTDEMINLNYVKVAVLIDGEVIVNPVKLSDLEISGDKSTMYVLKKGSLDVSSTGNTSETLVVKVWLDSAIPTTEIGKYLYLKLDVTSLVDEANTPEGNVQQNS
ncbi:MAG: hypothetical protein IJA94_00120 [Bacilli bacterium]|nr:hypothetical protein [Bacilli bacterium]